MGNGQWAVGSGQWAVGSGQWAVGSGQWAVVVSLQRDAALIVSLLIVLRTRRKATKRRYEMIPFDQIGWVTDEEFESHLSKRERKEAWAKKPI